MEWLMNIIGYPLGWIMWFAYKIVPIYPLALIIFTIIVRAAMTPMSVKQQRNQAHMQLLKPKVDAIQKKYKDNPTKAQEEVNKFYEKEGYNPFSGCSTLFLQLPIIYGFMDVVYRPMTHLLRMPADVITKIKDILIAKGVDLVANKRTLDIELKILGNLDKYRTDIIAGLGADGASIVEDLETINLNFLGMNLGQIPEWGWNLLMIIPILSLVTALISSFITTKMTNQDNAQGKGCSYLMMFGMPFMSAYFTFLVPAGVGLYWIISNVVGTVQQIILRKIITPEYVQKKLEEEKQKGKKKKKSKFMTKLLEAQKEAQAQQGAASQSEIKDANAKAKALQDAEKKLSMSDKEKLAEARKRYAEKYGDDIK